MSKDCFNLDKIASALEGLEETIIYKLIDRAQFALNESIYQKGKSGFAGFDDLSLFEIRLKYQEEIDSIFGRFAVPEERPYFKKLPAPQRALNPENSGFPYYDFDIVNQSIEIYSSYMELARRICVPEDDGQYGSSAEHDVFVFQAISRRIHYGALYVAESKFLERPKQYTKLIMEKDTEGLTDLLTRAEVERRILTRVREKADIIQKTINIKVRKKIDAGITLDYYRDTIIPLTKKGEILYLLNRPIS